MYSELVFTQVAGVSLYLSKDRDAGFDQKN